MDRGGYLTLAVVLALVGVGVLVLVSPPTGLLDASDGGGDGVKTTCESATPGGDERRTGAYDWTTVELRDGDDGTDLATVEVRIADTREKMYTGLSDTECLPDGEGMLFVHDEKGTYTYVMRRMDFPIDIVFVAENGTVTTIHHAPVPEEIPGGNGRFPGRGKYVLEVPRGYTNETGVERGDRLVIHDETRSINTSPNSLHLHMMSQFLYKYSRD